MRLAGLISAVQLGYIQSKFLNPARWPARSKARVPGFDRVGRVNSYLKKNSKRRRFSKKKSQRVAIGFLTGFCKVNRVIRSTRRVSRVTPGHGLCYFLSTRSSSSPGSTLRAGPGFKTLHPAHIYILWICSLVFESRVLYFLGCSIFSNTEIGNIHRQNIH